MVLAIALVGIGVLTASSSATAVATGETKAGATTPVLSARRTPALLARPVAGRRLEAAIAPVLATLPATSCVRIGEQGSVLIDRQGTDTYLPASSQKILIAGTALDVLGADTTFTTSVVAASPPEGGTVAGDLWLVGGGDPLLSTDPYLPTIKYGPPPSTKLEAIADEVVAAGVTHVTGGVRGDESRYDSERGVASWHPSYLADGEVGPLSGLSVNDSREYPAVGPRTGTPQPSSDPARYAASALTDLLRARGVTVDGEPAAGTAPGGAAVITAHPSLPLSEIVGEMLVFSDNNTAELLVKELAVHAGKPGTTEAGLDVIRQDLAEDGVDTTGLILADGSGLDRSNRVSCATFVDVLSRDGAAGPISSGMPSAGETGTLSTRYRGSPAVGKVHAKTGSLRDVSSLSGWVRTDAGRDLAFSVVMNSGDIAGARLQAERVTEALLSYPDEPDLAALGPKVAATQ